MGIFTPGEQRNTEYLKLKYSPSTPEIYKKVVLVIVHNIQLLRLPFRVMS